MRERQEGSEVTASAACEVRQKDTGREPNDELGRRDAADHPITTSQPRTVLSVDDEGERDDLAVSCRGLGNDSLLQMNRARRRSPRRLAGVRASDQQPARVVLSPYRPLKCPNMATMISRA